MTSIDLSNLTFNDCPDWYKNISSKTIASPDEYTAEFIEVSGFDINFEYRYDSKNVTRRIISGEDKDILMMILKWS